jgi:hypothetical protein
MGECCSGPAGTKTGDCLNEYLFTTNISHGCCWNSRFFSYEICQTFPHPTPPGSIRMGKIHGDYHENWLKSFSIN